MPFLKMENEDFYQRLLHVRLFGTLDYEFCRGFRYFVFWVKEVC